MDKIWLKYYQDGVPESIDLSEYASLVEVFEESCQKYANNIAFENLNHTISYAALKEKSDQFAAYLQQLGLEKGARVAIMLPNLIQYIVALFGILRAGMVVVNTNPLYTVDEVSHQMNDSGAEVIIILANFAHTLEKALAQTKIKHIIITEIGDEFPYFKRKLVNTIVKYIKKMVPPYHLPQAISYRKALRDGAKQSLQPVSLDQQSIAFLQYTGGTTGISKGAILTHGNMVANLLQASAWMKPLNIAAAEVIVTALPLYHIFSLTANCLTFLHHGSKNILITNPRDIASFIQQIKNSGLTVLTGVNTLFNALLNHSKFAEIDFSKCKLALSGGMALQSSVALRWRQKTNTAILEAYGLTETSPAVTINPLYLADYNGSIGLPIPSTEISIRDDYDQEVAIGQPGELCIKGPQVMPAYWNNPAETKLVFTPDGFLKTGDIANMDANGFIYLVDRKKDMIDVSGFNVYPNEIEQVISLHAGVLEVGVVGIIDEELGERVKACIVKRDPNLTVEDIIAHCRKHLTSYKIPKIVEFYSELPKTAVGKILKRALRITKADAA